MNLKEIGRKIKKARENKGYTQEQLAEKVNLSVQHISVIERGLKAPKLDTFIRIANVLGVNADFILSDSLNVSAKLMASDLYRRMEGISEKEKLRILKVVELLIEIADK